MPYPQFDRSLLRLKPLSERTHDMFREEMIDPDAPSGFSHPTIALLADRLRAARAAGAQRLMMMGAHAIKTGCSRVIVGLLERGDITHIAMNGACAIHDYELAKIGATSESVARYVKEGQFGLWEECGDIHRAAAWAAEVGCGLGEAIGRMILQEGLPYAHESILAAAARLGVPATVHVGIGCDIVHEHPLCDGAATGKASYTDFLIYAQTVMGLERGVFLNFGSAVFGPEVYLKCLSMARNVAHQRGQRIRRFTTAVFDLLPLEGEDVSEAPPKTDARYYFRPWKTILARTVADGGEGYYVQGAHADTLPALLRALRERERHDR